MPDEGVNDGTQPARRSRDSATTGTSLPNPRTWTVRVAGEQRAGRRASARHRLRRVADHDGEVAAAPDRCPHRESPLSIGTVRTGASPAPITAGSSATRGAASRCRRRVSADPFPRRAIWGRARAGTVRPHLDVSGQPIGTIPYMAAEDDPTYRRINTGVERWNTCALRMTDNFLDISHFPFVHLGTFGIADNQEVPKLDLVTSTTAASATSTRWRSDNDSARWRQRTRRNASCTAG